jgi:hypothetical protein
MLRRSKRFVRLAFAREIPLVASLLLLLVMFSSSGFVSAPLQRRGLLPTPTPTYAYVPLPTTDPNLASPIVGENALPGTTNWRIPDAQAASVQIQAYASAFSVSPGHALTFYISTQSAGTPYTVEFYRLGWYGGAGGRLLLTRHSIGAAQGYYDPSSKRLVGCSSCQIDQTTKLIDANWNPSLRLRIPDDWVTGLYVAKLIDANGWQAYVSFEVRGNEYSRYIAVLADNTTAAYNDWGGYSLYHGPDGMLPSRATKVSFNRPALGWRYGYGNGLSYAIDAIRWMERQGYDLSYISSVDLHEHPEQLLHHLAYISLGHDEYWSKEMRDGVESARNQGIGLAFFGANAAYWQVRYEPDSQGVPDRTLVCYKSATLDPLYGKDNSRVTTQWRLPPLLRPENALIGIMYLDWDTPPRSFPWRVSPSAYSFLLDGTGIQPGKSYGCDLVGYEWDKVFTNGATPPGLHVLGSSPTLSQTNYSQISNTAYYIASSGALVFASGSIYWSFALDDLRIWDFADSGPVVRANGCLQQSVAVPEIQQLMANVMDALIVHHAPYA